MFLPVPYSPRNRTMSHRHIDVHHHILPPSYVAWLRSLGVDKAAERLFPRFAT